MIANILLGILCLLCVFVWKDLKGLKYAFVLIGVFLALRYEWGNDYPGYLALFNTLADYHGSILDFSTLGDLVRNNEFGWALLNVIFARTRLGFFGLIIATSIFETWAIYNIISKYIDKRYYWLSIVLFVFSTGFFAVGASMMRQFLAACMFLVAVDLFFQKKYIPAVAICLFSATIHQSSSLLIFLLPLFLFRIDKFEFSNKFIFLSLFIYILFFVYATKYASADVINNIVTNDEKLLSYSTYLEENKRELNSGLGMILTYANFVFILYSMRYCTGKDSMIISIFLLAYLVKPFSFAVPMIGRFAFYFDIFSIFAWPLILKNNPSKITILFLMANLTMTAKSFIDFYNIQGWNLYFGTYKTILSAPCWM